MPIGRGVLSGKLPVSSGARDRYVTIKVKPADDTNPDGFPVEDWDDLGEQWMSKRDLRADERFAAGGESAFAENQWVLDYRPDMDPELVDVPATRALLYQGRLYDIVTASLADRKTGIELLTLAGSKL